MTPVDEATLRLMAVELARMAQRNERRAGDHVGPVIDGYSYHLGKAEGLRFAADNLTALVEPALKPPLRSVK